MQDDPPQSTLGSGKALELDDVDVVAKSESLLSFAHDTNVSVKKIKINDVRKFRLTFSFIFSLLVKSKIKFLLTK